jgi:hypothetical protein
MKNRLARLIYIKHIKQVLTSKIFFIPLVTVISFFLLFFVVLKELPAIEEKISSFRKRVHTQFCASLATGVPQEKLSPEQKSKFKETAKELPKCGDTLKIVDVETNGSVTVDSSAIRLEATGFSATDCDRAEITLRLVRENKVVWEKKEIDSSCSGSKEEDLVKTYIISLIRPSGLPDLSGAELEACFDLVDKSGGRASQNPVSACEILAFVPQLCQKIPIPNSWR